MEEKKKWKPRPKHMGYVAKWYGDKGYGFIRCYDDWTTYYCHANSIKNDERLVRGSIVEFEIIQDRNDPEKFFAYNVLICEVPDAYSYNVKKIGKKKKRKSVE